jgi:Zn-dependent protease
MTLHEFSHAMVSYKLGDKTAKEQGRLTLNPLKHIDPVGAIFLVIFHFGWAKPVPVYSLYFKNPKRDMAITAAAGPITNFLLAIFAIPLLALASVLKAKYDVPYLQEFFLLFLYINIGFGVFNLIPIPPLDGSRILMYFMPANIYNRLLQYEQYAFIILIVLMFTGVFSRVFGGFISLVASFLIIPSQALANVLYNLF